MALKSKVGKTTSGEGTSSLRTSLPQGAAVYLDVKPGDYIYWNMAKEDDFPIIILRSASHQEIEEKHERKSKR